MIPAVRLRLVHRAVRVLEQALGVVAVLRIHRNADARRQDELVASLLKRRREINRILCAANCARNTSAAGEYDDELIASHPGELPPSARAPPPNPVRRRASKSSPAITVGPPGATARRRFVAQGVVDTLELVKIHIEQRQRVMLPCLGQRLAR